MIDPRMLDAAQLRPLDATDIDGDFDRDEPCEIENTLITAKDMAVLSGVPFSADGCLFVSCDLSVASIVGVRNSQLKSCKLRGTHFSKFVRNVVFDSCQLIECSFRMMMLESVSFERCQLSGNDFYHSALDTVAFPSTDFQGLGFDRCTLQNVDLCETSDLQIGDPRTLTGAAMCETQMPLIAARLAELSGIIVRDC